MQRRSFLAAPLTAVYPLAAAEPEPRVYAFGDGIIANNPTGAWFHIQVNEI